MVLNSGRRSDAIDGANGRGLLAAFFWHCATAASTTMRICRTTETLYTVAIADVSDRVSAKNFLELLLPSGYWGWYRAAFVSLVVAAMTIIAGSRTDTATIAITTLRNNYGQRSLIINWFCTNRPCYCVCGCHLIWLVGRRKVSYTNVVRCYCLLDFRNSRNSKMCSFFMTKKATAHNFRYMVRPTCSVNIICIHKWILYIISIRL